MKKLISIILAISMLAAFIPAVSAAGGTDVTNNLKLVYKFSGCFAGLTYKSDGTQVDQYVSKTTDATGGDFWKFTGYGGTEGLYRAEYADAFSMKGSNGRFEIYVPESGKYNANIMAYWSGSSGSNNLSMTITNSAGEVLPETKKTIPSKSGSDKTGAAYDYGSVVLESGWYTVEFKVETASQWLTVYSLILTSGDASTASVAPFIKSYSEPEDIEVTGTTSTAIACSSVLSDGETASDAVITYSSSDDTIASIDANNGTISGIKDGIVTITATATSESKNSCVTKTKEITVGEGATDEEDPEEPNEPETHKKIIYDIGAMLEDKDPVVDAGSLDYAATGGFWKYEYHKENGTTTGVIVSGGDAQDKYLQIYPRYSYYAIKINVPVGGKYTAKANVQKLQGGTKDLEVYMYKDGDAFNPEDMPEGYLLGTINCESEETINSEETLKVIESLEAGEYYVVFKNNGQTGYNSSKPNRSYARIYDFVLEGENEFDPVPMWYSTISSTALEVGDTATMLLTASKNSKGDTYTQTETPEYSSDNTAVATVASATGEITAKKEGTATITAKAGDVARTAVITVSAQKAPTVSFYAESTDNTATPITITATDADGAAVAPATATTLNRGAEVTVTAPEKDGYLFVGWFRGSKENGRFVWADNEYSFAAMTHTMLTAVYEKAPEKAYYNFNGEFLGTEEPSSNPTMLGYNFDDWNETVYNNLTRCVANYLKDKEKIYSVTIPSGVSVEKDEYAYYYDTKVTLTSDTAVTWLRDDKPVAYGETYTFYVWDDVTITTDTAADTAPKVILDSSKSGAYMTEYDAGNKTVIEKGIIFGNVADITVDSCAEKMNSQRSEAHGQFSAESDCQYARGYLIYEDGNEYKVIYSE